MATEMTDDRDEVIASLRAELDRTKANGRKLAMLMETFVYEPKRITEGGLMAQIHRYLTEQDVEFEV